MENEEWKSTTGLPENSHAIEPKEELAIKAIISPALTSTPSGDQVLTESAFISLLQTKATSPRGADGVEAGRIIFDSIVYLGSLPYPPDTPQQAGSISLAQLHRALVWLLPDRAKYIIEQSNFSRMRTRWDRLRLLFQSLATSAIPLVAQTRVRDHARYLVARHAFDVSWDGYLDICAVNHDDDGDEIYHDLLDVLYSTQEERPPGIAPVPRDAFRNIAKQIKADEKIPELCTLAIPAERFKSLVKVLLVLQLEPLNTDDDANTDLLQYNDTADALCAAFAQDHDPYTPDLITWPSFALAIETVAPYIFEPLYRLLTTTFMNKDAPPELLTPPDPPRNLPEDAILTLSRVSQLVSFLAESMEAGYLRRTDRYTSRTPFPAPASLAQAIASVPEEAIVLFSGRVVASTAASAEQGTPCVFGLFSPVPRKDGHCIQASSEIQPGHQGQRQCLLFQLAPMQDVFRGVAGEAGWSVIADSDGGGSIVFGESGAVGGAENLRTGVVLVLREGLRRGQIRQCGKDGRKKGAVYEPNPRRGDWSVDFAVEEIEIWSEDPA